MMYRVPLKYKEEGCPDLFTEDVHIEAENAKQAGEIVFLRASRKKGRTSVEVGQARRAKIEGRYGDTSKN